MNAKMKKQLWQIPLVFSAITASIDLLIYLFYGISAINKVTLFKNATECIWGLPTEYTLPFTIYYFWGIPVAFIFAFLTVKVFHYIKKQKNKDDEYCNLIATGGAGMVIGLFMGNIILTGLGLCWSAFWISWLGILAGFAIGACNMSPKKSLIAGLEFNLGIIIGTAMLANFLTSFVLGIETVIIVSLGFGLGKISMKGFDLLSNKLYEKFCGDKDEVELMKKIQRRLNGQ